MEAANPGQVAGGGHVFTPLVADHPLDDNNYDDDDDDDGAIVTPAEPTSTPAEPIVTTAEPATTFTTPDHMEVDTGAAASSRTTSGVATGSTTLLSTAPPMSTRPNKRSSTTEISTAPTKKSASSSSRVSSRAESTSYTSASGGRASVRVMVQSMDSTVHSIMDVLKDGMISDRSKAVAMIQAEFKAAAKDDPNKLEAGDLLLMVDVFTNHLNLAESYLVLDDSIRRLWVDGILHHIHQKILEGMTARQAVHSLGPGQE